MSWSLRKTTRSTSNYGPDLAAGNSLVFRQRWSLALRLFQVPAGSRAAICGSVIKGSPRLPGPNSKNRSSNQPLHKRQGISRPHLCSLCCCSVKKALRAPLTIQPPTRAKARQPMLIANALRMAQPGANAPRQSERRRWPGGGVNIIWNERDLPINKNAASLR